MVEYPLNDKRTVIYNKIVETVLKRGNTTKVPSQQ